uniref:Uncharacterized protein n=1 Tax=viral metagenome TaxID=1070528 RepID=A0A6M3KZP1_9ZZZZ
MEDTDERIIRVVGDGKERNREIEHYRDFHCYGRQNIDNVCGNCKLRFRCFTDREYIEIPISDLRKRTLRNVTVKTIVNLYSDLIVKFVNDDSGKGHAKIDFNEVLTKNDV